MRTLSGMMLGLALAVAAGCGGTTSAPQPEPKAPPAPEPGGPPKPPTDPPAPATAGWEMDPAKHMIPATPVAGRLAGKALAPECQVQGETLRFRVVAANGSAEQELDITFREPGKAAEDRKLVVRPDMMPGPDVPIVAIAEAGKPPQPVIEKGYAMTLELGKREKGKVAGKIALSLPGDDKSYLSGTFSAEWVRSRDEPPGPDDAPFIHGQLTVIGGPAEPEIRVGYVRVDPFDPEKPPALDLLGIQFKPGETPTRAEQNRPRVLVLVPPGANGQPPGRYELLHLEPGRYWVFAAVPGGPAASAWATVEPGGKATADLTIDTTKSGGLEVTVPPGPDSLSVVPAAEAGKPWPETLVLTAASMIELQEKLPAKADKDRQVKFPRLAPGKYEVWAGELTGTAEVKPGETAKLTLMPKKK